MTTEVQYRYRLSRQSLAFDGPIYAFFGINPSTADDFTDDPTVRKWSGFVWQWCGGGFIVGNCFAARSTDVLRLAGMDDPIGPENDAHLQRIIEEADILVPCWGARGKIPPAMRPRLDLVMGMLIHSGKPARVFGYTKDGDPKHPLMLGYDTKMIDLRR